MAENLNKVWVKGSPLSDYFEPLLEKHFWVICKDRAAEIELTEGAISTRE